MFGYPRSKVGEFPRSKILDPHLRHVYTGLFHQAVSKTIHHIGTPALDIRRVRLEIAQDILGHEYIVSFKELSDAEVWSLYQWVTHEKRNAYEEIKAWLEKKYGAQLPLLPEEETCTPTK